MPGEIDERVWDGRGEALSDARLTQADARMADDLRLKHTHFRIMAHVGRQNNKRGWLRVSQSELAERWGVHRNTVNAAFKELVGWGYLLQRTQEEAGESFCQYKVALDGETSEEHRTPKRAAPVSQPGQGECSPETAPPSARVAGGECSPESAHVHSGGVHPCTVEEYTPHSIPRAHRLSPDSAEEKYPPLPPRGGQDGLSDRDQGLLADLRLKHPHNAAVEGLIAPLLAKRRFSAVSPLAALDNAVAAILRARLTPAHIAKVLEILLAADVKVIKADRLTGAIEAVRKGGLMLVIRRGDPEFAAWLRHFEATAPNFAALMAREGKWQVPAKFPPSGAAVQPGSRPADVEADTAGKGASP